MFNPFRSFSARIPQFAGELAQQIIQRYPPEMDQQPAKRPSVNRLTRIIEDACNKALEFREQEHLGWIAKARLANSFRWNLVDAGYSKEFAEFATEAIVVYLSTRRAPASASKG